MVSQYQETKSFSKINWGEVVISGAVGAVAGVAGAALIAPVAAAAGASVTAATGSALIGGTAELALGSFMAGTTNVILNNTQRAAVHLVRSEDVTLESMQEEWRNNYASDMAYGAAGFAIGNVIGQYGKGFWRAHEFVEPPPVFGEPLLSAPTGGAAHLLNPHPAQKIATGVTSTLLDSLSNSSLLEFGHKNRRFDEE